MKETRGALCPVVHQAAEVRPQWSVPLPDLPYLHMIISCGPLWTSLLYPLHYYICSMPGRQGLETRKYRDGWVSSASLPFLASSRSLLSHLLPPPGQHLPPVCISPLLPGGTGPGAVSFSMMGEAGVWGQWESHPSPKDICGTLRWEASSGTLAMRRVPRFGWLQLQEGPLSRSQYCSNICKKHWAGASLRSQALSPGEQEAGTWVLGACSVIFTVDFFGV
jgi:hypothetical protein